MAHIEVTPEEKEQVVMLFKKSKRMKLLTDNFRNSFKVLGRSTDNGSDCYIIWSPQVKGNIKVPADELLGQE